MRGIVIVAAVLVLVVAAIAVSAVGVSGEPMDAVYAEENVTPYHEHPDEYAADGDLEAVRSWLGGWLVGELSAGAIEISEDDADQARDRFGERFTERFGQFVDVIEEEDEDEASAIEETRDDLDRLAELMEAYNETWAAYEAALADGDAELAHALAREINDLAEEIEALSGRILDRIDVVPLAPDAAEAIEEVRDRTTAGRDEVRERHFTETELTLEPIDAAVSFLDPATVTGTLETVDGEPVANASIELAVNETSYAVETDGEGRISFDHRPVDVPAGETTLEVAYFPDPATEYLGSSASLGVEVDQVEPTLTLEAIDDEVGFGDTVSVEGSLAVDDVAVDGITLDVVLDGRVVGDVSVADGAYATTVDVPADVEPDDATLLVRLPFTDRALAGVSASISVAIVETPTTLEVDAAAVATDEVEVTGSLATVDGTPVGDQEIVVSVGDAEATVETDDDGAFSGTMNADADDEQVPVVASFDGTGTNLAGAEATTEVALPEPASTQTAWLPLAIGAGAIVLGVVFLGWWYRRRRRLDADGDDGVSVVPGRRSPVIATDDPVDLDALIDAAVDRYADEAFDEATVLGYVAARARLASQLEDHRGLTHWEFVDAVDRAANENGLDPSTSERLTALTTAFELATCEPGGVSFDEATRAIETSRAVVDAS